MFRRLVGTGSVVGSLAAIVAFAGCATTSDGTTAEAGAPSADSPRTVRGADCFASGSEAEGPRRLALLIGSSMPSGSAALPGAKADVRAFSDLLSSADGYGFRSDDVCELTGKAASVQDVNDGLLALRGAIRSGDDAALIFFAGAGAQVKDTNQDEPDPFDEAWALSDGLLLDDDVAARVGGIYERTTHITLVIDAASQPAAGLPGEGTLVRFAGRQTVPRAAGEPAVERVSADPAEEGEGAPEEVVYPDDANWPDDLGEGDGSAHWTPSGLPELVTLYASRLGAAVERDGRGVFTQALLGVLAEAGISYDTVAVAVPPLVAAESDQIPGFDGNLGRLVLDASERTKPLSWKVVSVDRGSNTVAIEGVQMPGWSPGAVLRIYPSGADAAVVKDPAQALGVAELAAIKGFAGTATLVLAEGAAPPKLRGGETVVLVTPGADSAKIKVSIREGTTPTDLSADNAQALRDLIARDEVLSSVLELVDAGGFAVGGDPAKTAEGGLQIIGPEGTVRNTVTGTEAQSAVEKAAYNLALHARQKSLLNLSGDPGTTFVNESTLQVRMVPAPAGSQDECAKGVWPPAEPNSEQIVPVCHRWQVSVKVAADAPVPLEVGGVVLFNDGNIVGFPVDGRTVTVEPGGEHLFPFKRPRRRPGLKSIPPLGITEHLLVYGTQVGQSVKYNELSASSTRSVGGGVGAILGGSVGGTRGVSSAAEVEVGAWTRSHVPFRVEANTRLRPDAPSDDPSERTRELTLNGFDISPFLPANRNSYLYKVMQNAEYLARLKGGDGLNYAQCLPADSGSINNRSKYSTKKWPRGSCWDRAWEPIHDEAELLDSPGIDCSTTVWYLFTRACKGDVMAPIPKRARGEKSSAYYARKREFHLEQRDCMLLTDSHYRMGYATTSTLANDAETMESNWVSCMDDEYRTGDMLVTRNKRNSSGHVYIVVDPENFVVFGSHAGDLQWAALTEEERTQWAAYEEADSAARDTGAEYQFLAWKNKTDLTDTEKGKWGGFSRERVRACWRNKKIAEEWDADPSSRPGSTDLSDACKPGVCP